MDIHLMQYLTKNSTIEEINKYKEILKTLKNYKISELECISGYRINAKYINFYINEKRNAILNNDGTVIITHKK
jgi:hypothetical protein